MSSKALPCPCCGFRVFSEPPGSYEICPICRWEDDPVQLSHPGYAGGANEESLWDCQQTILSEYPPDQKEHGPYSRDPSWRPLEPEDVADQSGPRPGTYKYHWEKEARCSVTGEKLT